MTNISDAEFADSIEVVSGSPSAEELAAVKAVLAQARAQQANKTPSQRSTWAKNDSILRTGIIAGNGQWGSKYKQGL